MADSSRDFDVLIVGAGPAGMAAAWAAAQADAKLRVGVVDDNPAHGGQIWRGEARAPSTPESSEWYKKFAATRTAIVAGAKVVARPEPGRLIAESFDQLTELRYAKLILATGARERFLPFSGWTLPNVMGAGGLQAMVKSGLPIEGKRVVVAGSGPLLLAVAAYLKKHGARVLLIAEQASKASMARFAAGLLAHPGKLWQARRMRADLSGVLYRLSCWPIGAAGDGRLERVTLMESQKPRMVDCDYLACGFHLVPNTELAELLGCELASGCVRVNDWQQTSVEGVYCAGEPTGIGGLELALIEGQIAGLAAAGGNERARDLFGARAKYRRFARLLERTFALRDELKSIAQPETLVCRCEDVSLNRLRGHTSWRAAKLETRCGMGACQGRVCGPAAEFLFGWRAESVRPPIFPARVEALTISVPDSQSRHANPS